MKLIIGPNSQIGKSLLCSFINREEVYVMSSNFLELERFTKKLDERKKIHTLEFSPFDKFSPPSDLSCIINCSGIGDPKKNEETLTISNDYSEILDFKIIDYLKKNPKISYFSMSTGGFFLGNGNYDEARGRREIRINIDRKDTNFYLLKKLKTEVIHRKFADLKIIDLRIFGFISEFINIEANFFFSFLIKSIIEKTEFKTNPSNFIRDYINTDDIVRIIDLTLLEPRNDAIDIFSTEPITKLEMLNFFIKNYNLRCSDIFDEINPMKKPQIISNCEKAKKIGFVSKASSIENIKYFSEKIFSLHKKSKNLL